MKWRLIFSTAMTAALLSSAALAADGASMFRSKCGSCHVKGGQAMPVNPADKASVVWGKYFKRGRHRVDFSGQINGGELEAIVTYLQDHAADSDQPEAAAIPK